MGFFFFCKFSKNRKSGNMNSFKNKISQKSHRKLSLKKICLFFLTKIFLYHNPTSPCKSTWVKGTTTVWLKKKRVYKTATPPQLIPLSQIGAKRLQKHMTDELIAKSQQGGGSAGLIHYKKWNLLSSCEWYKECVCVFLQSEVSLGAICLVKLRIGFQRGC